MFSESKMGPGYITLNVLRFCNIIVLLLLVVASWIMLVMTVKTSNFFFFDGAAHFIMSVIGIFLIVSEVGFFKKWYARVWPAFSNDSGLVALGLSMIALGFITLGNLNKVATSVQSLGLPMWRVVIASGILNSLFGLFNLIATYVFCNSKLGITGRQVRADGAAISKDPSGKSAFSVTSGSIRRPVTPVLPSYTEDRRKSRFGMKWPISISRPIVQDPEQQFKGYEDRSSPVIPEIQRPATSLHPAYKGEEAYPAPPPIPAPASSRYSVVSDMTRF
ncbi:hypothetical protein L207DRAFT_453460 [Hyaloscypha variabilis F]|uniref:DUF7598 domain-containing protein n=1 Tax=Hyaloscypha variabilis (strain UAMH 11265 / GT02V1 / F) TaxID=1149755 RepID=A0A2J6RZX4_HYAVF|nr:hypothetical protein L207DRAFT_453460 [Hyaloscypha variabilis F]